MDRIKKKKNKRGGEKKVLLSIVDPWDVKVASVDPVGLAERRGVSLSVLSSNQDEDIGRVPQEWLTLNRSRIPSPWYKPSSSGLVSPAKSEESTLNDSTWLNPWYSPQRSPIDKTHNSPSPRPSRIRLRESKQQKTDETRRKVEAGEVDNGLINGSQEISHGSVDDVDSTAVRVRFEIDKAEKPQRNGVRRENGQNVDAPRVLMKIQNVNNNSKSENERRVNARQNYANGVSVEKRKSLCKTDDVEIGENERNTNNERDERDDSQIIEEKPAIIDIIQQLVESRYMLQTATERRLKRMPSCRQQETSKKIDPTLSRTN
ncbi:uncharacterized protein LOC109860990 isoform X2 [Pseudomyrmex gracilis]|uniref:uncharacterized protein LOC109860990 isoform X2 n=1 Tax=Pseudomyrmex gracilis TaxID=219809 RepID=UPI0009954483|nr:uncharacterized protein LOC109860990 isoform X2 [Pseudomyrmex gracilis]